MYFAEQGWDINWETGEITPPESDEADCDDEGAQQETPDCEGSDKDNGKCQFCIIQ